MELWEILVPTQMENLTKTKIKPVRTNHHRQWDKFVRNISGGLTVLTPVKGQWVSHSVIPQITELGKTIGGVTQAPLFNRVLVEERMIPVRIACSRDDISKIIKFTLKHYRQEAVMCYRLSDEVLVYYNEKQIESA
jgi:hypothetical protein